MQYAHDFAFSTFSKGKDIIKHQINGSINNIKRTEIHDKDYIGMSKDTSIAYEIGLIKPGEKKELQICILIDENKNISEIEDEIERVKRIDFEKEYINTKNCLKVDQNEICSVFVFTESECEICKTKFPDLVTHNGKLYSSYHFKASYKYSLL